MNPQKKEPVLCNFDKVELSVPRLKLIKCLFKKSFLTHDEMIFLKGLLWRAESADNKIRHIISIADRALLKSLSRRT